MDCLTRKYKIITESEVIEEIKKYTLLKDFREKSSNYYSFVKKHKLYHLIKDLKKTKNKKPYFSILEVKQEIEKYEFLYEFKKESLKCYRFVKRHKLYYLMNNLKRLK